MTVSTLTAIALTRTVAMTVNNKNINSNRDNSSKNNNSKSSRSSNRNNTGHRDIIMKSNQGGGGEGEGEGEGGGERKEGEEEGEGGEGEGRTQFKSPGSVERLHIQLYTVSAVQSLAMRELTVGADGSPTGNPETLMRHRTLRRIRRFAVQTALSALSPCQ